MSTGSGCPPNRLRARSPILAAPAVWEDDGPTITGPIMSNTLLYFMAILLIDACFAKRPHGRTTRVAIMSILQIAGNCTPAADHRELQIQPRHIQLQSIPQCGLFPHGCLPGRSGS